MQDTGWNYGESFELGAGQPLLSMRLFCLVVSELRVPAFGEEADNCDGNVHNDPASKWQGVSVRPELSNCLLISKRDRDRPKSVIEKRNCPERSGRNQRISAGLPSVSPSEPDPVSCERQE